MLSKLHKSNKGFTIIEVMIVLAIAGLIILIVLLAIPALQRNGRNTSRKNDASAISAAVNEFRSNNEGRIPDVAGITQPGGAGTPDWQVSNSTVVGAAPATAKLQTGTTVTGATAAPAAFTSATEDTIYVVIKFKCNPASGGNYSSGADLQVSQRGTAVLYPVEQRTGNPLGRCIDS